MSTQELFLFVSLFAKGKIIGVSLMTVPIPIEYWLLKFFLITVWGCLAG
jgi:hypothetical protein